MRNPNRKSILGQNNKGQALLEFIMLLVIMVLMSRAMVGVINGNVAQRWKSIVNLIVTDNKTVNSPDVQL